MAITINGSGTVTGLSVGGLPDGTVDSGTLATDSVTAVKIPDTVESSLKSGRKNLIINGGFDVWQRGTSFSSPTSNTYLADRWSAVVQSATVSKESITDLPGFSSALKLTTGATDPYFVQKVEGTYFRGQTMTFSFWVKGDIPPHTMFYDYTNTFSAQTPILIDTVGAWKRYSNTYVLPTTAPTQDYLTLRIDLAESSSSIQYLTGVQAELGSVATDFEHRSYGEELALCHRYYQYYGQLRFTLMYGQFADTGGVWSPSWSYPNGTMRANPTAVYEDLVGNVGKMTVLNVLNNTNTNNINARPFALHPSAIYFNTYAEAVGMTVLGQSAIGKVENFSLDAEL